MDREELEEEFEYNICGNRTGECRGFDCSFCPPYKEWLEDKVIYLLNDVVPTMAKHIENRNEKITELEDTIDKFVLEVD